MTAGFGEEKDVRQGQVMGEFEEQCSTTFYRNNLENFLYQDSSRQDHFHKCRLCSRPPSFCCTFPLTPQRFAKLLATASDRVEAAVTSNLAIFK